MRKLLLTFLILLNTLLALGVDEGFLRPAPPPENSFPEGELPMFPIGPSTPTTGKDVDEYGQIRMLEKTFNVNLESKVNVFVPLEVITDVHLEGSVVGDQVLDIPFEVELNREPEKENYYVIKYSENLLDIDNDGLMDTYIHSPEYVNDKVSKDNFVRIYGGNISKEGTYKKDIYLTVEIGN